MQKTGNRIYAIVGTCVVLISCVQHADSESEKVFFTENVPTVEVRYAAGFQVEYTDDHIKIISHSFSTNAPFRDSLYILLDSSATLPESAKIVQPGENNIACLSSTHLAFLNELNALSQVTGLCGIEYVSNDSVLAVLNENQAEEICLSGQIQLEALYKSQADLLLSYPFGNDESQNYTEKGIPTFLIAEYLEESQLARLEWIKLFGLLTGNTAAANVYFDKVEEHYLTLKAGVEHGTETFIMNLPFQDQWFMPSAESVGVQLIEDAGLNYFYGNDSGTENQFHSDESVWNDGIMADYWVILARRDSSFSMEDLIAEEPVYAEFKSVKEKQVIFCNTQFADYFSQGVIEPDIILMDLRYALGQIDNHTPKYFFLLE